MLKSSCMRVFFYGILAVVWHFWTRHEKKSLFCILSPMRSTGFDGQLFEKASDLTRIQILKSKN